MLSILCYVQASKSGRAAWGLAVVVLLFAMGCTPQANYMRKWQPAERIANRWSGGTIRAERLSEDETAVFEELGTPDVIRRFRRVHTRKPVYAWIYEVSNQVIWFVDGRRVDYVAVDKSTLPLTRAERQTVGQKAFTGGVMGGVIGALATGFILLGEDIGLKN